MYSRESPYDELRAALGARQELGRDYEPALVESFLDQVETHIDARVDERLARREQQRSVEEEVEARVRARLAQQNQRSGPAIRLPHLNRPAVAAGSVLAGLALTVLLLTLPATANLVPYLWFSVVLINVVNALHPKRSAKAESVSYR